MSSRRTRNGLDVKAGGRIKFLWEDEESVALIIKNCEEKDAGLYRVIAKNELGEVSCSAKLGIKGAFAGAGIGLFLYGISTSGFFFFSFSFLLQFNLVNTMSVVLIPFVHLPSVLPVQEY